MPKSNVSMGTMTSPPPRPVSAPSTPAANDPATTMSAMPARLTAAPPAPTPADHWKHVKALSKTFPSGPLWLNDDGLNPKRTEPLLRVLASADSDALSLAHLPLTVLGQTIQVVN